MTISELEKAYQQLRDQLLRGELDEAEFKAEVEQLRFEDDAGNQWKIGWYTGKWYRYDEGQWVQGKPSDRLAPVAPTVVGAPLATDERRERRSSTPCLVAALIALLLVASVSLVIGWNADWWSRPDEEADTVAEITATETASITASETPRPTATTGASPTTVPRATPTSSRMPSPTATQRPPTATPKATTPTVKPTETIQTPTATPSRTPSPVATRRPRSTATPALSGRIFFPVYDSNPDRQTLDIYAVRLDTGKRQVVIEEASQPAVSSDGKRLAYRSCDSANRGILVRDLVVGNTWLWLDFHEAEHPSWSPNGENIVFSSQQESDREWRLYRTWGFDLIAVRRHGGDVFGRVPVWSADGQIIYWDCPLGACGLYATTGDGKSFSRLTEHEHDTAPAASPNGSRIAFMSNTSGNWEIYVTGAHPLSGQGIQEPKRLTKNGARDGLPTWSPDGRWLAFVTDRNGAWEVWVMRPDGSAQRKLFDLGGALEGRVARVPIQEQHGWTWETLAWSP